MSIQQKNLFDAFVILFNPISEIVVIQVNVEKKQEKKNNLPVKYSNGERKKRKIKETLKYKVWAVKRNGDNKPIKWLSYCDWNKQNVKQIFSSSV